MTTVKLPLAPHDLHPGPRDVRDPTPYDPDPHPRLLVLDVDGTLLASPPCVDFAAWEERVSRGPIEPVAGARGLVLGLLERHHATAVLLTARSERLRESTRWWLGRFFPFLDGCHLSMRALDDLGSSFESKQRRLPAIRRAYEGAMVLVDDEPVMRGLCGAGDRFVLAPEWPEW